MLVLGLDVGGTSTRAVLCSADGALLGRGTAAGGNPRSNPELAADHLQQAIGQALTLLPLIITLLSNSDPISAPPSRMIWI